MCAELESVMAAEERWYFTKEKLLNTPSRKCGVDPDKELSYRQQAANFIQDMGQRLQVNQLCINTAIVYVHRFYMFHSFTRFHRNAISTCALFLAAKVEEQPRKLEHVIKVAHMCLHREAPPLDSKSEAYLEQSHELISNENIMLQTLGFDVAIDHPHTHVVKCCQLVRGQHHHATASKDLAQTSYFMATNSLHLTTMCLQYKPTVVACVCIHLACKWAELQIPISSEGKDWYWYVDKTVSFDLLEELTAEFLVIFDRCPSRLKRKMMSSTGMNDKIQDVATVEKKLTAEFAAHASGNRSAGSSSSSSHVKSGDKSDKSSKTQHASWPSSMTAKVLGHDDRISDAEQNGTPVTPEVRRERMSSSKRDALVNCSSASAAASSSTSNSASRTSATAASSMVNCATSSRSSGSFFEPSTASSSALLIIHSPQPIVSPIRPSSRQTQSIDMGYVSNSQSSQQEHHTPHSQPAPPTTPPQSSVVDRLETPKKNKSESSGGRGMTPKEYRERKKRERVSTTSASSAAELFADEKIVETPPPPPSPIVRKRTSSSSSSGESSGNLLSLARHMQPIVALTSLNLTELTKSSTSKHGGAIVNVSNATSTSSKHHKQPRLSSSTSSTTTMAAAPAASASASSDSDHNNGRHKRTVLEDGYHHQFQQHQRSNRDDPLPALVRPPILTPSPPLATGEASKPDILEERPMTLSFPSEEASIADESPLNFNPKTVLSSTSSASAFAAGEQQLLSNQQVKADQEDVVKVVLKSSSKRDVKVKQTRPASAGAVKDRLIKHRKSKNQPVEIPFPVPIPQTPSVSASESFMVQQQQHQQQYGQMMIPNTFSDGRTSSEFRTSSPPQSNVTPTVISRLHPDENGGTSSTITISQERLPLPLITNSAAEPIISAPPGPQERKKQSSRPPSSASSGVNSTCPVLVTPPPPPAVPEAPLDRPSIQIPTALALSTAAAATPMTTTKHERRERHKHKDKDRDKSSRSSRDKAKTKSSSSSSSTTALAATLAQEQQQQQAALVVQATAPAIKLTIPKDRLNIAGQGSAKESIGGLKIRIPKRKISGGPKSKTTAMVSNETPSASVPISAPPQIQTIAPVIKVMTMTMAAQPAAINATPARDPVVGGGLKIKITKDRLGSMGTYSVGTREDTYVKKSSSSRKRERPPSPPPPPPVSVPVPRPLRPELASVVVPEGTQKVVLLPLPTVPPQQSSPMAVATATAGPISAPSSSPLSTNSSKPAKIAKMGTSRSSGRKSQSPHALVTSPYDVPPSSNTRSALKQDQAPPLQQQQQQVQQQRLDNYKPPGTGRGRGGVKNRGRGGGHLSHPHPRFDASQHQVPVNAGPYPYTPYYQYPPTYFNAPPPPMGPPPLGPRHPMHAPPPFFGQPPPFRGPPPPLVSGAYQVQRPDSRVMPPLQIRRHFPPPLPSEPPPTIPPPPPPE